MVRRRAGSVASLALAASIVGVVACDQIFGIDERAGLDAGGADATSDQATSAGDAPAGDAPGESGADSSAGSDATHDGPTGEASPDGVATDGPVADSPVTDGPVSCPIVYVSGSGSSSSDGNTGCSSAAPKLTISSAITYAQQNASVQQIWVCAGKYPGALTLDATVSLQGGYNCGTWVRQLSTYGYPSFSTDVTTITSNAAVTLTTGTTSALVDGFTITNTGTGLLGASSIAVRIGGAGTPTFSNDHIVGGGTVYTGTDDAPGSAGVLVTQGAAPIFAADLVEGGSGTTSGGAGTGSVGIYADGTNGTVSISGSTIRGGTGTSNGTSGTGSQGLLFTGSTTTTPIAYTLTGSTVVGGSGTTITCSNSCRATRGVVVPSGQVTLTLTDDAIDGGDEVTDPAGATTGTLCPHGVEVLGQGTVTATGNRIFGGVCNIGSAAINQASLYGMYIGSGALLTAENNMIHMGISYIAHGAAALGVSVGSSSPQIRHNTLIAGTNTGTSLGALWIEGNTAGAVVENNILASSGPGTAGTASGLLLSCPTISGTVSIASFQNNLVFSTPAGLMQWEGCNGQASYATVDAMTAELIATQTGATIAGNLTLAPTCGSDSGCLPWTGCTTAAGCLDAVFFGFADSTYGEANLFPGALFAGTCPAATEPTTGNGWPIAATPPCKVAQSTRMDTGTVPKDLYGNCRGTSPTIGAAEYTGSCL